MDISIGSITPVDYPAVLALWNNELGYTSMQEEHITTHYARVQNDDRYQTFVARIGNQTIGFITSVQSFEVGHEVGFIHITGIAVSRDRQNKDVRTQLLRHLEAYAKARNASNILLNNGFQHTDMHAFYERKRYAKGSFCFNKKVQPYSTRYTFAYPKTHRLNFVEANGKP